MFLNVLNAFDISLNSCIIGIPWLTIIEGKATYGP